MPKEIDHKDVNPSNNRIDNLREATRQQNMCNRKIQKNNKSGFKGVSIDQTISENGRKWRARIKVHRKEKIIGYFHTPEEAHMAYCQEAQKLHGEFARMGG